MIQKQTSKDEMILKFDAGSLFIQTAFFLLFASEQDYEVLKILHCTKYCVSNGATPTLTVFSL